MPWPSDPVFSWLLPPALGPYQNLFSNFLFVTLAVQRDIGACDHTPRAADGLWVDRRLSSKGGLEFAGVLIKALA